MTRVGPTVGFEDVVAEHYAMLVRRLTVVLDGDVEAARDVVQETCARVLHAWDRFDGTGARAWLYTIGLRLAFNERNRRARWARLIRPTAAVPVWVMPADRGLHAALASLRREHRAALLLNLVDGYTQAEIAAMLGIAPATVASWVSRAKAKLREVLSDA